MCSFDMRGPVTLHERGAGASQSQYWRDQSLTQRIPTGVPPPVDFAEQLRQGHVRAIIHGVCRVNPLISLCENGCRQ